MSEFLLELYSEEIPPGLQINSRKELKESLEKILKEDGLSFKSIELIFFTYTINYFNK